MLSILHLSDLHRSREEPLDNDALVAALLADRDRYIGETPRVPPPGAVIVSGDLIQGAPIGLTDWRDVLRDQYRVAANFLDHLARRFLNGDRSRLIIIPGNHDVCWNTSFSSMERMPEGEYPADLRAALISPDSPFRWSWKERALYKITKPGVYAQRLDEYWQFAESFYAGVPLPKPIDRNRGYQLFELHDRRIVVAAFDSTTGNDCFGYSGALSRGAVGRCDLDLRDNPHSYGLRVAVWHHSIQGPPLREDYMEVGQVHEMVGLGFQLGLHGHQHVAEAATHYVHLGEHYSMAVVSAGSLCAGSRELPRGVNRQYNLVVLEDDLRGARVYVREMAEGGQFSRKNNGAFAQGFAEVSWQASIDVMGRALDASEDNVRRSVLRAEDALHSGRARSTLTLLDGIELLPGSHARRLAIQAALKLDDWALLATTIGTPSSTEEAILLVSALTRIGALDQAAIVLADWPGIDPATRSDLRGQIEARQIMRRK